MESRAATPDDDQVRETAVRWFAEGRSVASATVIRTWRSSPRPTGSRMIVDASGRFAGSVSGGCVESSVVEEARSFLEDGRPRTLAFGVTDETAWEVGLPCGGEIQVFIGPAHPEIDRALLELRDSRATRVVITDLSTGAQRLVEPEALPDDLFGADREIVRRSMVQDLPSVLELGGRRSFVEPVGPPPHLIVVGAGHLGQLLCELAQRVGFSVTVVDPRSAFATAERFPDVRRVIEWPDRALPVLGIDRRTAVVVLSHDAKIDDPALAAALESDCFYIGALGGRKTRSARGKRLEEAGFDEEARRRIHGPVGLDIGALTNPEIAVAIVAEIVQCRRRAETAG